MIRISQAETVVDVEKFRESMTIMIEHDKKKLKTPEGRISARESIKRRIKKFQEKLQALELVMNKK